MFRAKNWRRSSWKKSANTGASQDLSHRLVLALARRTSEALYLSSEVSAISQGTRTSMERTRHEDAAKLANSRSILHSPRVRLRCVLWSNRQLCATYRAGTQVKEDGEEAVRHRRSRAARSLRNPTHSPWPRMISTQRCCGTSRQAERTQRQTGTQGVASKQR
mgnify:FL=1